MNMRDLLSRCLLEEPFRPMILWLHGGYELPIPHPELVVYVPGLPNITVYDASGYADTFNARLIVSIRRAG